MSCSVIGSCIVMAGNRNGRIDLRDFLITVGNHEGNRAKVCILIDKLVGSQTHFGLARVCPLYFIVSGEGEVVCSVQRIADFCIVAGNSMLLSVIGSGVLVTGDGYGNGNRGDFLFAVLYIKGYSAKVAVFVRELSGSQIHRSGADGFPFCTGSAAEFKISFLVEVVFNFHVITGDGMLLTVVRIGSSVSGDMNGNIDLIDLLIAVCHIENNVREVGIAVGEVRRDQAHLRFAGILPGRGLRAVEGYVTFLVQRIADYHIITANGMILSIVIADIVMAGNGNCNLLRNGIDLQFSVIHNDPDVAVDIRSGCEIVGCEAHGILAGIGSLGNGILPFRQGHGNLTGSYIGRITGYLLFAAVEGHHSGFTGDCNSLRRAVLRNDKLSGNRVRYHIVSGAVLGAVQRYTAEGHIVFANRCTASAGAHSVKAQAADAAGEAADGLFASGIFLCIAYCGQSNLRRVYGQRSVNRLYIGKLIGLNLASSVSDDVAADNVRAAARIGLAAGCAGLNGKSVRQARASHIYVFQFKTVIGLAGTGSGQNHFRCVGSNLQRAQVLSDCVVVRIHITPSNAVAVAAAADFRLAPGRSDCHGFVVHQPGNSRFTVCQGSSVVSLAAGTGSYRHRSFAYNQGSLCRCVCIASFGSLYFIYNCSNIADRR